MRALVVVIAFAGILLLALNLPAFMNAVEDYRTDINTQTFQVTTGGGETNANLTLSKQLWDNDVANVVDVSSNESESAAANSYNSTLRQLNVNGLNAGSDRTLVVEYKHFALDDYTGANSFAMHLPTGFIFGIIGLALSIVALAFK